MDPINTPQPINTNPVPGGPTPPVPLNLPTGSQDNLNTQVNNQMAGPTGEAKVVDAVKDAANTNDMISGSSLASPIVPPVVPPVVNPSDGIIMRQGPELVQNAAPAPMQPQNVPPVVEEDIPLGSIGTEMSSPQVQTHLPPVDLPSAVTASSTSGVIETEGPPPPQNYEPIASENGGLPPIKKEPKEKIVYKKAGPGLFGSIKRIGCLFFLIVLIALITLIVTVIFRPAVTWNPLKDFLNSGFKPGNVEEYTAEQTIDVINSSLTSSGETTLSLNEAQVTSLIRSALASDGAVVEFEVNKMRLVSDIDSATDKPLWLIVEFNEQLENKLEIKKIGFGRFGLPEAINSTVNSFVLNLINLSKGDFSGGQSPESLIGALITNGLEKEIEILDVKFLADEIEIRYGVK